MLEKHIEDKAADLVQYLRKYYPTMAEADITFYTNMLRRIIRKAVIEKSYVDISYFEHFCYYASEEVIASITNHPLVNLFLSDDALTSRQTALIETARESIEEVY